MRIQDYIRDQPDVIAAALRAADTAPAFSLAGAVLIGSGSSLNALSVVAETLPSLARPPVVGPSAYLAEDYGARPALILSQSGASTTSVAAAERALGAGGPLLIVTCEADSPLARLPASRLVLCIGGEPIGPKTKGFTATLAAVLGVAARANGAYLPEFSRARFAALIEAAEGAAEEFAAKLDHVDNVVIAGNGRFLGIALEASLKVAEITGFATAAFTFEELLHGRLHGVGPESLVVMIVAATDERHVAETTARVMAERGVQVRILNLTKTSTSFDWMQIRAPAAPLDALAAIAPFQWLATHLALRRSMEPEAMRYPGLSKALSIKLPA